MAVEWIWLVFIFAFGACIGSFLNVVIYRLPREKSLVSPPSACPSCNTPIRCYNNIPLFSWLLLRGKCPDCKAPISCRYFLVELITSLLFGGLYLCFFWFRYRQTGFAGETAMQQFFTGGGWLFYLGIVTLFAVFLAASAIDLELWIIPLELCWFVTIVGFITSGAAEFVIGGKTILEFDLFPAAVNSPKFAAVTVGATVGLIVSLIGLYTGIIKPSYEMAEDEEGDCEEAVKPQENEPQFNDRKEIMKEIVFLLPVVIGAIVAVQIAQMPSVTEKWAFFIALPVVSGLLGSVGGYLAGCAVVWATRIFGTLGFGKEAMGLGDVHLMGAAGAVIGAKWVVLAFFIAPFFGILWALYQAIFKKMRQIPYGPFLSLAVFAVIIFHDWMQQILSNFYGF
ncbi:MAG: prepilin peptidase [Planctomycetota bacterium]|jgi:leader peptidase (prepilin peptidase)/N-methyltransferase